ncbi:unnamed protein product, partial [Sphenostylis stenocarpa]
SSAVEEAVVQWHSRIMSRVRLLKLSKGCDRLCIVHISSPMGSYGSGCGRFRTMDRAFTKCLFNGLGLGE